MAKYNLEPNLLYHYFSPDSATYQIIGGMRKGFLNRECRKFDSGLVERAKAEVDVKRRALDASTFPFAQDLSRHVYERRRVRAVMLVEGTFYGDDTIGSIIPIDLGKNPYLLFKDGHGTTIDDYVTMEKTREFKDRHRDYLRREGYRQFKGGRSRFFYFCETDLAEFLKDGELDLVRLLPLIMPTKGYVVLDKVGEPSFTEYMQLAPPHVSYRLKRSLRRKLLKRLALPKGEIKIEFNRDGTIKSEEGVISDWVAHRIVVDSLQGVHDLERFLASSPTIGSSKVEYLYSEDRYEKPSKDKFKAIKVLVRVIVRGYEPCIRGIQIVDKKQHFINELEERRRRHDEHEKKESMVARKGRARSEHYGEILETIFGKEEFIIDI